MKKLLLISMLMASVIIFAGCISEEIKNTSNPEGTVRAFLDEVNKGNYESAKVYFSGQYAGGYDKFDKAKLEKIFPPGSIRDATFSNVKVVGDSATLTVTVIRSNGSPYVASLSMINRGGDWKINYDGINWPFPPG